MRRILPSLALLCALLLALPLSAQAVRVVAVDAVSGRPLQEVLVRLEAADGTVKAADFTRGGPLALRADAPGTYRVRGERAGYHAAVQEVTLARGPAAQVELRLERRPLLVDTVTVIARSENERGRDGFLRRQAMGAGVFLDSAFLAPRAGRVPMAGDLLQGVPDVQLSRRPGANGGTVVRSTRRWQCMVLLVDGRPPELEFKDGGRRNLHQMLGPMDVKAVEVYRDFDEVPAEYRPFAREGMFPCGVYLFWTRARW